MEEYFFSFRFNALFYSESSWETIGRSFLGFRMLKKPKKPIFKNCNIFEKYPKGGPLEKKIFSFLFNTVFYSGIPKETIRMPFRGLTMLKSRKLVIKGGLCYRFAMVCPQGLG